MIDIARIRRLIKGFDIDGLFEELGWDRFRRALPIVVYVIEYQLTGIREKRGFRLFHYLVPSSNEFPTSEIMTNTLFLSRSLTAIFRSSRCNSNAILKATKWIADLAEDRSRVIIGGFHFAMEKGLFEILLDGKCRICLCPARGLALYRIPRTFRSVIESGRLAIVSSLPPAIRSNSACSSNQRNQLVADFAEQIVVTYAAEGSRTEEFALSLPQNGRVVDCLDVACSRLIAGGARVVPINSAMGRASE